MNKKKNLTNMYINEFLEYSNNKVIAKKIIKNKNQTYFINKITMKKNKEMRILFEKNKKSSEKLIEDTYELLEYMIVNLLINKDLMDNLIKLRFYNKDTCKNLHNSRNYDIINLRIYFSHS